MTTDPDVALEACRASKRYGRRGTWALQEVDLALAAGRRWGLVGPNGAGKSTLIRSWLGFERLTCGEVRVHGSDPSRERKRALLLLAYVPQTNALYKQLTVADHLDLVRHYRGRIFDASYASGWLAALGIPLGARAGSLSGGQGRLVELALALGMRARVILLDEPVASLDPLARAEFFEAVQSEVDASGSTLVMASHQLADIDTVCDSLVLLGGGRPLLVGTIAEIRRAHEIIQAPLTDERRRVADVSGSAGLVLAKLDQAPSPMVEGPALGLIVTAYLKMARTSS